MIAAVATSVLVAGRFARKGQDIKISIAMKTIYAIKSDQNRKPRLRGPDVWLAVEIWGWTICAAVAGFDVLRTSTCHLWRALTSGASNDKDAMIATTSLLLLGIAIRIIFLLKHERASLTPNYLFRRKDFGLSAYWPINAELLATALIML